MSDDEKCNGCPEYWAEHYVVEAVVVHYCELGYYIPGEDFFHLVKMTLLSDIDPRIDRPKWCPLAKPESHPFDEQHYLLGRH